MSMSLGSAEMVDSNLKNLIRAADFLPESGGPLEDAPSKSADQDSAPNFSLSPKQHPTHHVVQAFSLQA